MEHTVLQIPNLLYHEQTCQCYLPLRPSVCVLRKFPPPELSPTFSPTPSPVSYPSCELDLLQLHLCSTEESCTEFLLTFHRPYPSANGALTKFATAQRELALCLLILLLVEPGTAPLSLPFGKPSSPGQPPTASRWGALSSSKRALSFSGTTTELSVVLSVFLKSAYSQNPSTSVGYLWV